MKLYDVIGRLAELRKLPGNWDSYGGVPLAEEAYEAVLHFLQISQEPSAIVPLADGGAQIEWYTNGIDVTIIFKPDGSQELS